MEDKNPSHNFDLDLKIAESSFRKIQAHYSGILRRLYYRNKIEKDKTTLIGLIKNLEPLISDESLKKEWEKGKNVDIRTSSTFAQALSLKNKIQVYLENQDNFSLRGYFNRLYGEMKSIKKMLSSSSSSNYHQI